MRSTEVKRLREARVPETKARRRETGRKKDEIFRLDKTIKISIWIGRVGGVRTEAI
jgi:hypothetical protein